MRRRTRHRVVQRKQHQAGEKSADMRLPGHAGAVIADGNRPEAEDDVDAEPHREEAEREEERNARSFGDGHSRIGRLNRGWHR